ncbi:MAG: inositol monophosphatase [Silicimonas sp.]|nr:inositol monophosphatase [Silicimonas sp.]
MIPTGQEIEELTNVVRRAGAEVIMPRFRNLAADDIATKSGPMDVVTVADRTAEEAIRKGVEQVLPGAAVIGEEAVADDPRLLDSIGTRQTCVIVEPIDGTGNFVAGLAVFGSILAVEHEGQTVFGLLHDPVLDDWMFAIFGGGAWFRSRNGAQSQIRLRAVTRALGEARGFVTLDDYETETRKIVREGFDAVFHIRDIRCSCHEYRLLASGYVDFLRSFTLKPWDHAVGLLLLEEGGGRAAVDGKHPNSPTHSDGRIVAARSEAMGRDIANLAAALP